MVTVVKKRTFGKNFIILPLVFVIISFISFYFVLSPVLLPVVSVMDMFFSGTDSRSDIKLIYDGASVVPSSGVVRLSEIKFPSLGTMFGNLSIENTDVKNVNLYFGDGLQEIRYGVGVYNGGSVPGGVGTTLIAGHNNTYFHGLKDVKIGYNINIKTNYGKYIYKITGTKVADHNDTSAYTLYNGEHDIILYTCYPFDVLGFKTNRYFVYADLVSGPIIDFNS